MGSTADKVKALLFFIFVVGIMFVFPITLILGKGGLDHPEVFRQLTFYTILGSVGIFLVSMAFATQFILKKKDKTYGDNISFFSIGEKPAFKIFKRFTGVQLLLIMLIVSSSIFLMLNLFQTGIGSLTGLRVLPQQFTATDSLLFSTANIPASENMFFHGVLASILIFLGYWARKKGIDYKNYRILVYALIPIMIIFGIIWHISVYGTQQASLLVVALFWGLGAFLTLAIGFFGVFWIIHLTNNFFIDIARFLSQQQTLIYIGLAIFLMVVTYFILYRGRLLGKKQD